MLTTNHKIDIFKKYKRSLRLNKGSVLVEAAFTIPILLGIMFLIIEFGNVLYLINSLNQISRSAARYASVTTTYSNQDLITASGANNLLPDPSKLTLTITPTAGSKKSVGTTITVSVSYSYTPIINPFKFFKASDSWAPTISSSAVARSEVSSG